MMHLRFLVACQNQRTRPRGFNSRHVTVLLSQIIIQVDSTVLYTQSMSLFLRRRAKRGALLFAFSFFSPKRDIPLHL